MKITDAAIHKAVMRWPLIVRSCPGYAWSWGHHTRIEMFEAYGGAKFCIEKAECKRSYCQVEPYVDRPKSDRRWDKPGAGRRAITEVRW
jgi:hypothetical protein